MKVQMLRSRLVGLLVAAVLLVMPTLTSYAPVASAATPAAQAMAPAVQAGTPEGPGEIINWNKIALSAAVDTAKLPAGAAFIYVAYTQAAVYDAVVAIEGGYQPYKLNLTPRPDASVNAAVAAAAHDILVHYFPAQQAALDADYAASLANVQDGAPKLDGIQLGQEAAAGIIALRQGDGLGADIGFSMPTPAPGVWQLPAGVTPQTPWMSKLSPFMLQSPDQFRPGPPPDLLSTEWATEFNEIKTYGGSNSTARTPEQTDVAKFWSMFPTMQFNNTFQQVAVQRGLDVLQTARLFAMGDLVSADVNIACFDGKYNYLFWRPLFSVPLGDYDGNLATAGDPNWTPLLATPNHPEYPAAHGCETSAMAEMFTVFFGTSNINLDIASTVPGLMQPTHHFATADGLVTEIINARVWGGLHYRGSVIQGTILGRNVAQWTLSRYFLPTN